MNKLWMAILFSSLGQIFSWFHMQGQFKYEWARSWWWIILGGIPISIFFYFSTRWMYEYFGNYWYVRPIGFGIATIIFGLMTSFVLGEMPSQRIIVSLMLAALILYINISPEI